MFVLKVLRDVASLMLFGNFDHNLGPKYLIECLPYFTELNLGIIKVSPLIKAVVTCNASKSTGIRSLHARAYTLAGTAAT